MRELPLTKGKVALVDEDDFDLVNQWRWHVIRSGKTQWYARRTVGRKPNQKVVWLHQFLSGYSRTEHKDGNGLNCRHENLRPCPSQRMNMANSQKRTTKCTSQYKGVSWWESAQQWVVQIKQGGKRVFFKYCSDEKEAARAYDAKALELFGEYARLNFGGGLFQLT